MRLPRLGSVFFACSAMLLASLHAQPVVHLTFDNPGQLARDFSGRGHDGAKNGTVIATSNGKSGGAAQFDGNGSISLGNSVAAVLGGDFTISLWLATTSSSGGSGDSAFDGRGIVAAGRKQFHVRRARAHGWRRGFCGRERRSDAALAIGARHRRDRRVPVAALAKVLKAECGSGPPLAYPCGVAFRFHKPAAFAR